VTFLIDGYNLMHAVGLLGPTRTAGVLRPARTRFLDWLAGAAEGRAAVLRVVFDAEKGRGRSAPPEADVRGVKVRFAFRRTADDEIEDLLAVDPRPERLTVVSNDMRVQEAGRRRGAAVRTCQQFVDWLIACGEPGASATAGSAEPEKPAPAATADEMAAWLAAFSAPKPNPRKG
jgi:predicted RNA-binding protein with PIN domain